MGSPSVATEAAFTAVVPPVADPSVYIVILEFVSQQTYAGSDAPEERITFDTRLTVLATFQLLQTGCS